MKSYKNTILPGIKLKYFERPDIKSSYFHSTNFTCYKCGMINIPFIGSVRDGYSDNPKYFCEDCSIDTYMKDYDFETREAALSWRRRIFDVGYFLNELIIDRYLKEKGMPIEDLPNEKLESLSALGRDLYNTVSKKKKSLLESIPEQSVLEKELQKICKKLKLSDII